MSTKRRVMTGYLAAILAAVMSAVLLADAAVPGECPQPRFTGKAPDDYYSRSNPFNTANANTRAAEPIFQGEAGSANCAICHGRKGDGKGALSGQYDPPPRNFSCAQTVAGIPDGQLFWIIRFGSPGTAMPSHAKLKDDEVWQLVLYVRQLAK